jgi:hypothetical protein
MLVTVQFGLRPEVSKHHIRVCDCLTVQFAFSIRSDSGETSVYNRDCGQLVPKPAAASKTNWLDGSADSASKPKKQVPHQQTTAASVPALPQGVFRGNGGHLPPASVPVAAVAAIP